jgi:hypothetical protein
MDTLLDWFCLLFLLQFEDLVLKHMKSAVQDPQLQQQLTPDFSIGCKRILASDDYYPALVADNVKLVPAALKQVGVHQQNDCTIDCVPAHLVRPIIHQHQPTALSVSAAPATV